MHHTTLAFWLRAPGEGEIRTVDVPAPGPDDVVVRTRFSAVSRGTEALVFRGGVPAAEHGRMRAPLQAGDFPFPVKYGYAAVGEAVAGPPDLAGRMVFVLHPHQDRFAAPASQTTFKAVSALAARAARRGGTPWGSGTAIAAGAAKRS